MTLKSMPVKKSGVNYFFEGLQLIKQPGLRVFVVIPLLVNFVLFGSAMYFAFGKLGELFEWMNAQLPEYLAWLDFFLWPLAVSSLLVVMSFVFSSVMNWIAAPFNGLLAEKVENHLTGKSLNSGNTVDLIKDLPRIMKREWTKFKYYLPRAIGFLVLFLLPGVGQTIAPILWFLFTSWMMAIQYCDYPFDNHKVPFDDMKRALSNTKGTSYSFGASVTLFSMIPILNLFVMPIAICGATAMWVDRYREVYKHPEIARD
ncbi:sulfate transporter CysZ [Shewanella sp. WXL01]|uniref:Sulfate transporter CysZ n=1 Tax=Shewanella maritima TaxID=2520507 RepID=A0A411PDH5_9GAMM|nr:MULTISPECIES: sulfate transporter CysZ [Shewanella]NKF50371.1 sulfate transporter CysZ [Shewanella sp. WXL01]QBF81615.1 sulfate transporter CysZ [Shewanella maritima]